MKFNKFLIKSKLITNHLKNVDTTIDINSYNLYYTLKRNLFRSFKVESEPQFKSVLSSFFHRTYLPNLTSPVIQLVFQNKTFPFLIIRITNYSDDKGKDYVYLCMVNPASAPTYILDSSQRVIEISNYIVQDEVINKSSSDEVETYLEAIHYFNIEALEFYFNGLQFVIETVNNA